MTNIWRNWRKRRTRTGRHSFAELRARMSPEARATAEVEAKRLDTKMDHQQWRICFEWADGQVGPSHVEIVDYH